MKNLNVEAFLLEAGARMPFSRDMSAYDGKLFQCACGSEHEFQSYLDYRNFASSGANAKMIVTCPKNTAFFVVFDRFVSLAGCKME